MTSTSDPSAPQPHPARAWAAWAGVAGGLAAAAVSVKGILSSGSSTAAIGFIFVPFIAIAFAVLAGVWGLALGTVVSHHRGRRAALRPVLLVAWVVAIAAPSVLAWEVAAGLALQRAVHALAPLEARALDAAFETSPFRRNKFFLGALAQHPRAAGQLLDDIASLDDPELYEGMGSLWDVMGTNRKGIPVMRLVASHANARPDTLARMAAAARTQDLLADVLANPRTPMAAMRPYLGTTETFLQRGLALNPNTPADVLDRLSRSDYIHTRFALTWNPATPTPILERLANDADPTLARHATQALERRRGANRGG